MSLSLGRFYRRIVFRLLILAFVGLAAVMGRGSGASATTFEPSWSATLANGSPGASSSITLRLSIPSPSANFGQLLNFIPPDFEITPGADIPNGALAGTVNANATLSLVNGPCNTAVSPTFEMMEASIDLNNSIPIYAGFYDNNNNGLLDNVDYYPSFLSIYAPQVEPVVRLYGQTVVAGVIVPLNFVIFEPGAAIPLHPALDPALGYPTVVIIGDPIEPIQPLAISDFCSPLETATTLRGVSQDNPATPVNEGGLTLRRNPGQAGAFNSVMFARSRWDADADGIENDLDPCPHAADATWDPRGSSAAGDADLDGLPDSCDPNDSDTDPDQDGDGYLNRQDPCPRLAEFYPYDSDRDGIGDSCDVSPNDASDAGAAHRHDVCLADTIVVGVPASEDPPPVDCPGGPDLPIPPVFDVYPEESIEVVGSVHSVGTYIAGPNNAGPAAGVDVRFEVSGANQASGSCLTDNFGSCEFNYQGANPGLDMISASASVGGIDVHSEATNEWVNPPANDAFADATPVAQIPFQDEMPLIAAHAESDEPSDCFPMANTVWYRFTPSETAYVTIEAATNGIPVVLAAYTGPSLTDLTLIGCDTGFFGPPGPFLGFGIPPAGDDGYYFESYLTFAAQAGVTYQIQVGLFDSYYYYPEMAQFSIDFAPAGDANCSAGLSVLDALEVLRMNAGLPTSGCAPNGDITCDGAVNAVDALMILRVVAAIIDPPAVCLLSQS